MSFLKYAGSSIFNENADADSKLYVTQIML